MGWLKIRWLKCINSLEAHTTRANKPNISLYTPWKIIMEPENDGLEDDFPFQLGDF